MSHPDALTLTMDEVRAAQDADTERIGSIAMTKEMPQMSVVSIKRRRRALGIVAEWVESWRLAKWVSVPLLLLGLVSLSYFGTLWLMPDVLPNNIKPPAYAEKAPQKEPAPSRTTEAPHEEVPVRTVQQVQPSAKNKTETAQSPTESNSPSPSMSPSPSDKSTKEAAPSAVPSDVDTTRPPSTTPSENPVTESPEVTPPASPVTTPDIATPPPTENGTVAP